MRTSLLSYIAGLRDKLMAREYRALFIGVILFFLLLYVPVITSAGLIYDDWSVAGLGRACPGIDDSYRCFWGNYVDRPLAPLYYGILSNIFHGWSPGYFIFVSLCWLAGVLIVMRVLYRRFGMRFALPFALVALMPSIATTVIFSPGMQGVGAFTFMLWALSFRGFDAYARIQKKRALIGGYACILAIMMLYESSIPLFGLSVIWPFIVMKRPRKLARNFWVEYAKHFVLPFLAILVVLAMYQKFFVFGQAGSVSKVRILKDPHAFDFLLRVITNDLYIFIIGVPNMAARGLVRLLRNNGWRTLLNYLAVLSTGYWLVKKYASEQIGDRRLPTWRMLFAAAVVIMAGLAGMHFIAVSPPTIVGYLNRALVGGAILVALTFAFLLQRYGKNRTTAYVLSLFFMGYTASFIVQRNNYIAANRERHRIEQRVAAKLAGTKQDSMFVLAEVPTYLPTNFNNETIFSDEVLDWGNFLHVRAKNRTTGGISLSTERLRRGELKANPKGLMVMGSLVEMARLWHYDLETNKLVKIEDQQELERVLKNIRLNPKAYPLPADAQLRESIRSWLASY